MTWGRIDDGMYMHPKFVRAGNAAIGLWARAMSYSNHQLTDGVVDAAMIPTLGGSIADAEKLVEVGLWDEEPDGYSFHDWHEYNSTRESVLAKRKEAADRMATLRANRKAGVTGDSSSPDVRANKTRSSREVRSPQPNPTHSAKALEKRGSRIPDDWAIDDGLRAYAAEKAPATNVEREAEKFVNYFAAATGKTAVKLDWRRAFQNWLLSSQERAEVSGWKPDSKAVAASARVTEDAARDAWLAQRGVSLAEYEERKHDRDWLASINTPRKVNA